MLDISVGLDPMYPSFPLHSLGYWTILIENHGEFYNGCAPSNLITANPVDMKRATKYKSVL